jgi:hypothetical protein
MTSVEQSVVCQLAVETEVLGETLSLYEPQIWHDVTCTTACLAAMFLSRPGLVPAAGDWSLLAAPEVRPCVSARPQQRRFPAGNDPQAISG